MRRAVSASPIAAGARPGSPFVVRLVRAAKPVPEISRGRTPLQRKEEICLT